VDTYESGILFAALDEVAGSSAALQECSDGFLVTSEFFKIGVCQGRTPSDHPTLILGVSDQTKYKTLLDKLEERDQALAAGRVFAQALRNVGNGIKSLLNNNELVDLGRYVFQGPDGPAGAAAFLARNIPNVIWPASTQPEVNLASIIASVPSRRVTELTSGMLYEIKADFLSYRLQITEDGQLALSAHLHPDQLVRDSSLWFSSSTAAKEITSILLATGVAHVLPKLVEHAAEKDTNLHFGNGYASLSRMICGMIFHSREPDLRKLRELDKLFDGRASQFSSLKWGQKCAEPTVFNEFNGI
jgi:hypothetical protein